MYNDLVNRLREADEKSMCGECGLNLHTGATKKGVLFAEAADAIEELQRRLEQALYMPLPCWIPVTKQLPEAERKSYWVCTNTGYQCKCRWTNNQFGIGESDEWGWSIFDIPQYQKVVAWMSLPCPYEPLKEEKEDADS